jgi:guanidinoacetate N-methyltransferase
MMAGQEMMDWGQAPAVYDEHTLKILGKEVMEDWETGYMQALAQIATSRGGVILELGYGMGISASEIQSADIESHVVVECHPEVIKKCVTDNADAISSGRLHVFSGLWQDVTLHLAPESFDGILFDTYPIKQDEMIGPHMYFFDEAHRLLKPGGVLTYYSDEATGFRPPHMERLLQAGFLEENIGFQICDVEPPENCEYWQDPTIIAPIVTKPL